MTEDHPAASVAWFMATWLPLFGTAVVGASGIAGYLFARRSSAGERVSAALHVLGSTAALLGAFAALRLPSGAMLGLAWGLPIGSFRTEVDGLSAAFLVPLVIVPAVGSVYGLQYWRHREHPATGRKMRLFYGVLAASLILITIARDGVLFLLAWEGMALSAFFLVTTEDRDPQARAAGWVYFVSTHVGTLALFGLFVAVHAATGSFRLDHLSQTASTSPAGLLIFPLGLLAFGLKAGLMPLHVWLPGAHAAAPSHVSAVLSGVVLKTGIYGLLRITAMLPHPPLFWGAVLLVLGVISGVAGVVFAVAQHDLKRLLAYHSIENIGIIVIGLGLATLGRSLHRPDLIALGLGGAILHVWNHSYFKSLLFLSAGSVVRGSGTREIDQMGGLARRMPMTAIMFLCGAVAICGLPPLNGFASELMIYLGLLRTLHPMGGPSAAGAAFAIPALALIGALAVACFVKVFGAVFLGSPRDARSEKTSESPRAMLIPMSGLAVLCIAIGLAPAAAIPFLDAACSAWTGEPTGPSNAVSANFPSRSISLLSAAIWAAGITGLFLLRTLVRPPAVTRVGTWDCGYASPSARMQYTSSSFAQTLVGIFAWMVHPRRQSAPVRRLHPRRAGFQSHVHDVVLEEWFLPAIRWASTQVMRLRVLQTGRIQIYILYVLIAVLALVLSIVPVVDLLRSAVAR